MKKPIYLIIIAVLCALWLFNNKRLQSAYDNATAEMDTVVSRQAAASAAQEAQQAASNASSNNASQGQSLEIPVYESSRGGQIIKHTGFTLSYDADYKTPQWVAWKLTAEKAAGDVPRKNHFEPDPDVRGAKAYHEDYTHSGYDRGHMAPAGDMKWSEQAMKESFYTSNICPQNKNLNKGDWKDLEEMERTWATSYGEVSIAAGPIYTSSKPERIGNHKVAVPDAFFKVLLVGYPQSPKAYGFIFPNKAGTHPLTYYQLTVDEVEQQTGIDFFPALPDDVENKIEAEKPLIRE